MNVWHDISHERIATKSFEVFIDIPKGCKAKYENNAKSSAYVFVNASGFSLESQYAVLVV